MRSLYRQTRFRFRQKGYFSNTTPVDIGVFQGGSGSGNLFRKFLQDASDYLDANFGIVISHTLLAHLLWADDMVLFSESVKDMQKLLNCLFKFCSRNLIMVNEAKTKCMVFGTREHPDLFFNNVKIKIVTEYKYLGNILSPIIKPSSDLFHKNYDYLCSQARRAVFALKRKLAHASPTPPALMLNLFEASVKPILVYGSDNWGLNANAHEKIDVFQRKYLKNILCVKSSTFDSFVYGETGCMPLSLDLSAFALRFYHRLYNMSHGSLVKLIFDEMVRMSELGFSSWVTEIQACLIINKLNDSLALQPNKFKDIVTSTLHHKYLNSWHEKMSSPIARTFTLYKTEFRFAEYLSAVKIFNHRKAVAQLRCSSHHLAIETGRWSGTKLVHRICPKCRSLENEIHFVCDCHINRKQRAELSNYIFSVICNNSAERFNNFRENLFLNLMSTSDESLLRSFARFCYSSFQLRKKLFE